MELTITHLYPDDMNLYGDLGNIITLKRRCELRGINVNIHKANKNESIDNIQTDIYFLGGGQDHDQLRVFGDLLLSKKNKLTQDLEDGVPMLAICGGYQLLGEYFLDSRGNKIEGIGFLPLETVAPGPELKQRAIGNLITRLTADSPILKHPSGLSTLVGFENHSGRTRLKKNGSAKPLGTVLIGEGDNEDGYSDGVIYKNTIGSYMHGSLLPKNPHLADFIILQALNRRYGTNTKLAVLDDNLEIAAHKSMLARYNL